MCSSVYCKLYLTIAMAVRGSWYVGNVVGRAGPRSLHHLIFRLYAGLLA
jgi:hypothetical protein